MQNSHPLDDFIWKSLTSCHQHLAAGDALALRYPAPIGPFAVLGGNSPANWKALACQSRSKKIPNGAVKVYQLSQ